ncbi:hypothetical protein [Algibacter sp. PT7-4]|uniref:hypothetical protein n=1 Tax=Algibacter ulvanivorans TaxID=3400999 RepID=UPI003AAB92FC
MEITIKSNLPQQTLTVSAGGAKQAFLTTNEAEANTTLLVQHYPNITVNKNLNTEDYDGLINGASYTDYYNLAKN